MLLKYKIFRGAISAALVTLSASALSGGFDQSDHPYSTIFTEGNTLNFSYFYVDPDRPGTAYIKDDPSFNPIEFGSAQDPYSVMVFGAKVDFNNWLSCMIQHDNAPYGIKGTYNNILPEGPNDTLLESSESSLLCSTALTQDPENEIKLLLGTSARNVDRGYFSVSSKGSELNADALDLPVFLQPLLNSTVSPLTENLVVDVEGNTDFSLNMGFSWEKKSTQSRISFMYMGETTHKVSGTMINPLYASFMEKNPDSFIKLDPVQKAWSSMTTPASMYLDISSGLSEKWQIAGFAGVKYVKWGDLKNLTIEHNSFLPTPVSLDLFLEDTTTYYAGLGKQFTDNFSAGLRYVWEGEAKPPGMRGGVDARKTIALGGNYTYGQFEFTPILSYTILEEYKNVYDDPYTADFPESSAFGYGMDIKYTF